MNTQWSEIFPKRNKLLDPAEGFQTISEKLEKGLYFFLEGNCLMKQMAYCDIAEKRVLWIANDLHKYIDFYSNIYRVPFFTKKQDVLRKRSCANFEMIKRYINFGDNNHLNTTNKFANVGIFYDVANKILQQFGFFHSFYSI